MVSPAVGKVVLLPFPFSDFSESKLRPAVIVADAGRGDWVLCRVTSKPYGDSRAIRFTDESFRQGSLRIASCVRPGKPFTASVNLMLREVGILKPNMARQIVEAIIQMLQRGVEHEGVNQPPNV